MNSPLPARRRWPRALALITAAIVLIALAAATFTLSYDGIHAIALGAGVPPELARAYPGLLDAALVIACLAAIVLRDGRWWARGYAWLAILVIVAAGAAANALHAMNVALPHRQTAGAVAAAPWAFLLLAFSLWLTALRQPRFRSRRAAPAPEPVTPLDAILREPAGRHAAVPAASRPVPGVPPATVPAPTRPAAIAPPAAEPDSAAEEAAPEEETAPGAEAEAEADTVEAGTAEAGTAEAEEEADAAEEAGALDPEETGTSGEAEVSREAEASGESGTYGESGAEAATVTAHDDGPAAAGAMPESADAAPTHAASRPRDYWDDEEEDDVPGEIHPVLPAPTESPAMPGGPPEAGEKGMPRPRGALPTEMHHSLSDLAAQAPPLPAPPPAPRLNRLRSAPVPPEEDAAVPGGDTVPPEGDTGQPS